MRWTLFAVLTTAVLSACSSSSSTPTPSHSASLRPLWQLKLPASAHPALSEGAYISQELNDRMTKVLGTVAVDTATQQVLWRRPYPSETGTTNAADITGNYSATHAGLLISYHYTDGLIVREPRTNIVRKTIPLPDEVVREDGTPSNIHELVTLGDLMILRMTRYLIAYDMDDLINPAQVQVTPVWQQTHEHEGPLRRSLDNVALDTTTGTLAYGLVEVNQAARTSRTTVRVLEARTGTLRWERRLQDSSTYAYPVGSVIGTGSGMVVANLDGTNRFQGFRQETGEPVWTSPPFTCPGGATTLYAFLDVHDSHVLAVPRGDHCFSSWNVQTGAQEWVFDAPVGHHASFVQHPLVLNGVVYASNNTFWAIDAASGTVLGHSGDLGDTQFVKGTPKYDARNNQILVWGQTLNAFRPVR
ncbi:outer membrane protein assembly factor BamB family protein [Deinococcus aquaedulcis]|uniref:outer membrane protein assembly factor BamB family protein n=1 Tax=Deinococcus aquaedulcis TaxID=2840455 RepID=UPI001C829BDC|nr:PQQ-binding-like beta-propeller repeat protein [Deinococcus aquaedulcis]